jgi:hypothetical protein
MTKPAAIGYLMLFILLHEVNKTRPDIIAPMPGAFCARHARKKKPAPEGAG